MEQSLKVYRALLEEAEMLSGEIEDLKRNPEVQDYVRKIARLFMIRDILANAESILYAEEMRECSHIWVTSEVSSRELDGGRTDVHVYETCLKCGLDTKSVDRVRSGYFYPFDSTMASVLRTTGKIGIDSGVECSYPLAKSIYDRIVLENPGIIDDQAILYLRQALYNIRRHLDSETVNYNRARRLSLAPDFINWNKSDIYTK